jgi:anti-anti-sigma factor
MLGPKVAIHLPIAPHLAVGRQRPRRHHRVGPRPTRPRKVLLAVTIARAAQRDNSAGLVDLSMVASMDAATVGAMVESRNRLEASGQALGVRSPSPRARRVLELCGLTDLIVSSARNAEAAVDAGPTTESGRRQR